MSDSAEQQWILDAANRLGTTGNYWLGMCREAGGSYSWITGEPITYTNWDVGEPQQWAFFQGVLLSSNGPWRAIGNNGQPSNVQAHGTQELPTGFPVGWSFPSATEVLTTTARVVCADIDGDRLGDLLLIDANPSQLSLMRGDGLGHFAPLGILPIPTLASDATVTDVNGDHLPDIIIAHPLSTSLSLFSGLAGGGWQGPFLISLATPVDVVLSGDVTGDWVPDIVCASITQSNGVQVLSGDGAGNFAPITVLGPSQCSGPLQLMLPDAGGRESIAAVSRATPGVRVYRKSQTGSFDVVREIATAQVPDLYALDSNSLDLAWSSGAQFHLHSPFPGAGDVDFPDIVGIEAVSWIGADGRLFVGATQETVIYTIDQIGAGGAATAFHPLGVQGARYAVLGDVNADGRADILSLSEVLPRAIRTLRSLSFADCNGNLIDDPQDISAGTIADCNGNYLSDVCEIASGATADCNGNSIPDMCELATGAPDCNENGVPDSCDIANGTGVDCDGDGALDPCQMAAKPALDLNADGRLDSCQVLDQTGTPFCFGDATGAACPCDPGQAGGPGSGCLNSFGTGGRMHATGLSSVGFDLVRLIAQDLPPAAVGLFFQGTMAQTGGTGTAFGDGLLCVNNSIRRLGIRGASSGVSSLGYANPGDQPISVTGALPPSGGSRYYQLWYRDPPSYCTSSTFNLTNGVRIDWLP